jgi:hypothetical protein
MTRPVVGICLDDDDLADDVVWMLRGLWVNPLVFSRLNRARWRSMIDAIGRDRIVCAIDDDPDSVMVATSLGIDGVIFSQPWNTGFSWHLRAADLEDCRTGLTRLLRIWQAKRKGA